MVQCKKLTIHLIIHRGTTKKKCKGKSKNPIEEIGILKILDPGFPGGAVVENLPANAGDTGLSPGLGRSHMMRSN